MAPRSSTRAAKAAEADAEGIELTDAEASTADEPDRAPADEPEPEREQESGTRYLNITRSPLVYDRDGRQVGGGEWTPPVNLDAIGQAQRRLNHLLPPSAL